MSKENEKDKNNIVSYFTATIGRSVLLPSL
jgi:hypothetical protein